MATEYDPATVTHVVLESAGVGAPGSDDVHTAARRATTSASSPGTGSRRASRRRALVPVDDSVLFAPVPSLDGLSDMDDVRVCLTGYTGDRRAELISVVERLGAEYMRVLDRKSTHLVCYEFEGAKWAKANQTGLQRIVSHRWLEECLRRWAKVPEAPYSTRSGKEEDELAAAAAEDPEIPDSEDEGTTRRCRLGGTARAGAAERKRQPGHFRHRAHRRDDPGTTTTPSTRKPPPRFSARCVPGPGPEISARRRARGDALAALAPGSGRWRPPRLARPGARASQPTPTERTPPRWSTRTLR